MLKDVVAAIEDDDAEAVQTALDCGLDPESRYKDSAETKYGSSDGTLLHWAARYDSSDSAKVVDIRQFMPRSPFALGPYRVRSRCGSKEPLRQQAAALLRNLWISFCCKGETLQNFAVVDVGLDWTSRFRRGRMKALVFLGKMFFLSLSV